MKKKLFVTFTLILTLLGSVFAQQRTVTGTVTAVSDGLPLPGVTVVVKEAGTVGTVTDVDGEYSIQIPAGAENLVFSFIGMDPMTVRIQLSRWMKLLLQPLVFKGK